jgi:hypothetical protein
VTCTTVSSSAWSLALKAQMIETMRPRPADQIQGELSRLADGLGTALDELREISHGIHPALLFESGLGPALGALARRSAVPVELDLNLGPRLDEHLEAAAYYIASEAITNAAKYARASVIDVCADARDGALTLSISDDGVGGADPSRGSGIIGLRDRIRRQFLLRQEPCRRAFGDRTREIGRRIGRDQDDGRSAIAVVRGQTPGQLKPALSPEYDVHQDNLRPELLCSPQCLS